MTSIAMASRVCCAQLLCILLAAAMSPGGAVPVDRHVQDFGQTKQEEQSVSDMEKSLTWEEYEEEKPEEWVLSDVKKTQEWVDPITERIPEWIEYTLEKPQEQVLSEMKMAQEWGQPVTERIQEWGEYKLEKLRDREEWVPSQMKMDQDWEQLLTILQWTEPNIEEIQKEIKMIEESEQPVTERIQEWGEYKLEKPQEWLPHGAEEGMLKPQKFQEGEEPKDLDDGCCMTPDDTNGSEVFNIFMDSDRDNSDIVEDVPGQLAETLSTDKENTIIQEGSGCSYFGTYLVTSIILVAILYIAYHYKHVSQQKNIVLVLQGRHPNSWEYQRLEEKISLSAPLLNVHEWQLSEKPRNGLLQP